MRRLALGLRKGLEDLGKGWCLLYHSRFCTSTTPKPLHSLPAKRAINLSTVRRYMDADGVGSVGEM